MPGCIVSATTASFKSVEKRLRRATPVITSTFENVSDIGICLGLSLGPPAIAGVRSKWGALHHPLSPLQQADDERLLRAGTRPRRADGLRLDRELLEDRPEPVRRRLPVL